jgi:hypothetical protein
MHFAITIGVSKEERQVLAIEVRLRSDKRQYSCCYKFFAIEHILSTVDLYLWKLRNTTNTSLLS